jgi:hypothetical protein
VFFASVVRTIMETAIVPETSVNFYRARLRSIPEDSHHIRCRENLKTHKAYQLCISVFILILLLYRSNILFQVVTFLTHTCTAWDLVPFFSPYRGRSRTAFCHLNKIKTTWTTPPVSGSTNSRYQMAVLSII